MAIFRPAILSSYPRAHWVLALLMLAHLALDVLKEHSATAWRIRPWISFSADQALHLLMILIAAGLLEHALGSWGRAFTAVLRDHARTILGTLAIYLATLFAGGYLIRALLPAPKDRGSAEAPDEPTPDRIGMHIGWLERFLVVSAVLAGAPTLIGLILAGKSVVRYKRLEEERFAEYFLLGTLLSLSISLVGGVILRWFLYGTWALP